MKMGEGLLDSRFIGRQRFPGFFFVVARSTHCMIILAHALLVLLVGMVLGFMFIV